jgi:hypothetical protein
MEQAGRARGADQPPAAQLVLGLVGVEAQVAGEEAGLARGHEHLGVGQLPAQRLERADVVGVRVGEDNRIQPPDAVADGLDPELRGGIDEEMRIAVAHQDGTA